MPRRLIFHFSLVAFAILANCGNLSGQKSPLDAPVDRRHSQGPLTPDDYRAEVPDAARARGLTALTTTDVKYDFRYHLSKQRDKLVGRVESITVFAVVLRDQSWNKTPQDKVLLDHEQGHFDLAQAYALRAQAELTTHIEEEPLEASGTKEIEVQQTLDREIRKRLRPFVNLLYAANNDYDRATGHGTVREQQAQARKEQKELLKKLSAVAKAASEP